MNALVKTSPPLVLAPAKPRSLEPVLTPRLRVKYGFVVLLWLAALVFFWSWWLQPQHNVNATRFTVVTLALGWISFLQLYFMLIFLRASRSVGKAENLKAARVAMIVTKTASEPFDLVRHTLKAMLAQDYPHDTWLADEDPSDATITWCAQHGVKISTRKNQPDYHRSEWPRRTRCKEGNLAYFYDKYGYESYDFVSQLDADHVPAAGYLRELLKPFVDDAVGYVTAPSICSRNADNSWSARARLYSEALFHGALQSGYSNGWAPMCIGSHYAVRTAALKDIGGLGPELAEDHSTSLIMNSKGWRGVHSVDAIAIGDGPATFADMVTQEFQWSRSLVSLLLRYTPGYFWGLRPILKFQFVFSQLWYVFFACFMLMAFIIPIWALTSDELFAQVTFPAFVGHSAPAMFFLIVIAYQIRNDGLSRPFDAKVISWERSLFALAQWPWVLWGCLIAILDRVRGQFVDFRVTPKGTKASAPIPLRVLAPIFLLVILSVLPIILVPDATKTAGFYLLSLMNAFLYTTLFIAVIIGHIRENKIALRSNLPLYFGQFLAAGLLIALIGYSGWLRGMHSLYALSTGLGQLQFVQAKFVVSGAGAGPPGMIRYTFGFRKVRTQYPLN